MKYPKDQYTLLVRFLKEFSTRYDPSEINSNTLHYTIYQQGSPGQTHNHLYINKENGAITRQYNILDMTGFIKWLDVPETFELYPEGINDTHIETAVKRAIKETKAL